MIPMIFLNMQPPQKKTMIHRNVNAAKCIRDIGQFDCLRYCSLQVVSYCLDDMYVRSFDHNLLSYITESQLTSFSAYILNNDEGSVFNLWGLLGASHPDIAEYLLRKYVDRPDKCPLINLHSDDIFKSMFDRGLFFDAEYVIGNLAKENDIVRIRHVYDRGIRITRDLGEYDPLRVRSNEGTKQYIIKLGLYHPTMLRTAHEETNVWPKVPCSTSHDDCRDDGSNE